MSHKYSLMLALTILISLSLACTLDLSPQESATKTAEVRNTAIAIKKTEDAEPKEASATFTPIPPAPRGQSDDEASQLGTVVNSGQAESRNCNGNTAVSDPKVEIDWMSYQLASDILWIQVKMVEVLTNDFDFSLFIVLQNAGGSDAEGARMVYLWQLQNNVQTTELKDAYTGSSTQEGYEFTLEPTSDIFNLKIPLDANALPISLNVNAIHKESTDSQKNCNSGITVEPDFGP